MNGHKQQMKFEPHIKELLNLPFDQFSRQFIAYRAVSALREKKQLSILDVGGHGGKTREFLPGDMVTVVDLYDVDEPGYIKADALDLPFEDNEFDVVMSFDVLEHIPGDKRERFLNESLRVSKGSLILAAPFYSKAVAQSEFALNYYYKNRTGEPHQWLSEHIEYRLPKMEEVEGFFNKKKLEYTAINSNNLDNWTWLQFVILMTASGDTSSDYIEQLYRFYNSHLNTLDDHGDNSYRKVYVVSPNKVPGVLNNEFRSDETWEDQLKLREIIFQHLDGMRNNLKHNLISEELNWYRTTNLRLSADSRALAENLRQLQAEMAVINNSKGWRAIKLLRKIRQKLTRSDK